MVVFSKRSRSNATTPSTSPNPKPTSSQAPAIASPPEPKRWSDIAAGRTSTHPNLSRSQDVFGTFELCEQILGYLPMKDVLRATQVCRNIKEVVGNSTPLQIKLFLKHDPALKKLAVTLSDPCKLLSGVKAEEHFAAAKYGGLLRGEIELFVLHPIFRTDYVPERLKYRGMVRAASHYLFGNVMYRNGLYRRELTCPPDVHFDKSRVIQGTLDVSSISNMLLSQPPVTEVDLFMELPSLEHKVAIRNKTGVTIGQVLEAVWGFSEYASPSLKYGLQFNGGFMVGPEAQRFANEAGEISEEDDPTRWEYDPSLGRMKKGRIEFG